MNKYLLVFIFFLASCTSNNIKQDFIFSNKMSFNEFKNKLNEYARNSPYPNIND